jgi:regulator of replication initiation timing
VSNNTETNNRDRDIAILKSTINDLTKENKQLLESNEQLKIEDSKLRDFIINIDARELDTQIRRISAWSKLLLEYYKSSQQFSEQHPNIKIGRENIILMTQLTHNAALKLHYQVEDMKHDISRSTYR